MIYFYTALLIIAAALIVTDIILRQMENLKSFGFEKRLFNFKGADIPIEKFFPETLLTALICLFSTGAAGVLLDVMGFRWYLSLPFSIMTGMLVCFVIQHFLQSAVDKYKDKTLPKGDKAAGVQGFAVEEINNDGAGYGLIEFEYNDVIHRANAVSVNETTIPEFEKIIILFEEDGVYLVQSIKEVYEPLNE